MKKHEIPNPCTNFVSCQLKLSNIKKNSILGIVSLIIIISCETKNKGEYNFAKAQAEKIITSLTQNDLNSYKYWNYLQRGALGFWHTDSPGVKNGYTCTFNERNDSLIIEVYKPQQFIQDFVLDIPTDSSLIKLTLIKSVDTCFFITEDTLKGQMTYISVIHPEHPVFKAKNPFNLLQNLNQQKDSLKIIGISSYSRIGNFIQFYLPGPYILSYLPDSLYLNPASKDIWQNDFDRGEMLSKNWNLRKPS